MPKPKVFNAELLLTPSERDLTKMFADKLINLGIILLVSCCFFGSRVFKYDLTLQKQSHRGILEKRCC